MAVSLAVKNQQSQSVQTLRPGITRVPREKPAPLEISKTMIVHVPRKSSQVKPLSVGLPYFVWYGLWQIDTAAAKAETKKSNKGGRGATREYWRSDSRKDPRIHRHALKDSACSRNVVLLFRCLSLDFLILAGPSGIEQHQQRRRFRGISAKCHLKFELGDWGDSIRSQGLHPALYLTTVLVDPAHAATTVFALLAQGESCNQPAYFMIP